MKERRSFSDLFTTIRTKDTSTGKGLIVLSSELYLFDCCVVYTSRNHWVTTLGVKSYWEYQSSSKKLCKLHPAERSIDLVSTHHKGCNLGQRHSYWIGRASSGVITNFLCLVSEQNQFWLSQFGTSCCWEVPLMSVGPDSAELFIAVAQG